MQFFVFPLSSFEKIAKNISIVLFALVLLGAIVSQRENVVSYFAQAGLVMLFLNVIMMIIVLPIQMRIRQIVMVI